MSLEPISTIIETHGVPKNIDDIVAIIRHEFDADAGTVLNPQQNEAVQVTPFEGEWYERLTQYYSNLRESRGMSSPHWSVIDNRFSSLGRVTSPRLIYPSNPVAIVSEISQIQRDSRINRIPHPVVLDQNTRVDSDVTPINGDLKHLRIQLINTQGVSTLGSECHVQLPGGRLFATATSSNESIDIPALEADGWKIIKGNHSNYPPVNLGAYLDKEVDPDGTQLMVFNVINREPTYMGRHIAHCINELGLDRGWNESDGNEIGEEVVKTIEDLKLIMDMYLAESSTLNSLKASLPSIQRNIERHTSRLANEIRSANTTSAEIRDMEGKVESRALEQFKVVSTIHERIKEMRPVKSAQLEGLTLTIKTHEFGMRFDEGNVLLPSLTYTLFLSQADFNSSIRVCVDDDHDNDVAHPHAYLDDPGYSKLLNVCWGNAARALAESWGRKDWMSYVRILFGWQSQYNGDSPHVEEYTLLEELPHINETGWLVNGYTLADSENEDANETVVNLA